jgi:hypothetical protein
MFSNADVSSGLPVRRFELRDRRHNPGLKYVEFVGNKGSFVYHNGDRFYASCLSLPYVVGTGTKYIEIH